MKKMIVAAGMLIASYFAGNVYAQLSLGAGLDYNLVLAGSAIKTPSINLGGTYGLGDGQRAVIGNFRYFIPAKYQFTVTGNAFSSMTDPQYIEVPVKSKVSFFSLSGGVRNYFKDGSIEDGGFYGSGAVGMVFAKETVEFGSYDHSLYDVGGYTGESLVDFFGIFGVGYDFRLNDNMFLGAELPIAITMQGINSRDGSSSPIPIIISPGVFFRYQFN